MDQEPPFLVVFLLSPSFHSLCLSLCVVILEEPDLMIPTAQNTSLSYKDTYTHKNSFFFFLLSYSTYSFYQTLHTHYSFYNQPNGPICLLEGTTITLRLTDDLIMDALFFLIHFSFITETQFVLG